MCWENFHEKGIHVGVLACWWKWQVIRQRLFYHPHRGSKGEEWQRHSLVPPSNKTQRFCKQNLPISHSHLKSSPLHHHDKNLAFEILHGRGWECNTISHTSQQAAPLFSPKQGCIFDKIWVSTSNDTQVKWRLIDCKVKIN